MLKNHYNGESYCDGLFAKNIRYVRQELGLSQKIFAQNAGIYAPRYCNYERARRLPTKLSLNCITDAFRAAGVSDETIDHINAAWAVSVKLSDSRRAGRILGSAKQK